MYLFSLVIKFWKPSGAEKSNIDKEKNCLITLFHTVHIILFLQWQDICFQKTTVKFA